MVARAFKQAIKVVLRTTPMCEMAAAVAHLLNCLLSFPSALPECSLEVRCSVWLVWCGVVWCGVVWCGFCNVVGV